MNTSAPIIEMQVKENSDVLAATVAFQRMTAKAAFNLYVERIGMFSDVSLDDAEQLANDAFDELLTEGCYMVSFSDVSGREVYFSTDDYL